MPDENDNTLERRQQARRCLVEHLEAVIAERLADVKDSWFCKLLRITEPTEDQIQHSAVLALTILDPTIDADLR